MPQMYLTEQRNTENKCSLRGSFKDDKRYKIKPSSRSPTEQNRFSTDEGKSAASKIDTILMPEIEKRQIKIWNSNSFGKFGFFTPEIFCCTH